MTRPLDVFESWPRSQVKDTIKKLDSIEAQVTTAIEAQNDADVVFRDYLVRELPRKTAEAAQRRANREADKAVAAWNRFVYDLPWEIRSEYVIAGSDTDFRTITADLEVAWKDLSRADHE